MLCLGRPYHFSFFKGCLSQILVGLFLNNLTHLSLFNEANKFLMLLDLEVRRPEGGGGENPHFSKKNNQITYK